MARNGTSPQKKNRGRSRARRATAAQIVAWAEERLTPERLDELSAVSESAAQPDDWNRLLLRRVFGLGLGFVARSRRLDATVAALLDGDPDGLAELGDAAATAFLADPAVIRNARKLAAVRHNAAVVVALRDTYGDLATYAAALTDGDDAAPAALLDDLRSRLRLVGPVSAARMVHDLGVDALVPHPAVLRTFHRLGWLEVPKDGAAVQSLAARVAPGRSGRPANRMARLGAAVLAFATGRWARATVCGDAPACERCPAYEACARVDV